MPEDLVAPQPQPRELVVGKRPQVRDTGGKLALAAGKGGLEQPCEAMQERLGGTQVETGHGGIFPKGGQ